MGKGMPAALVMATVRATLRAAARDHTPRAAWATAAAALEPDLARSESFVTLFHARLDPSPRHLLYADSGHGLGFSVRQDWRAESIAAPALPLGILPDDTYDETSVHLAPGDALYVYSDGLLDAPAIWMCKVSSRSQAPHPTSMALCNRCSPCLRHCARTTR